MNSFIQNPLPSSAQHLWDYFEEEMKKELSELELSEIQPEEGKLSFSWIVFYIVCIYSSFLLFLQSGTKIVTRISHL